MGKNGKSKMSTELREELVKIDEMIEQETRAETEALEAAKSLAVDAVRGDPKAEIKIKGHETATHNARVQVRRYRHAETEIRRELSEAIAREDDVRNKERAKRCLQASDAVWKSGRELGAHLLNVVKAIQAVRDDIDHVHRLGGVAPSGEVVDVGLKDLIRTTFAALPWLQIPQPNRRWMSADELVGAWAALIKGGAQRVIDAPPSKPKPIAPPAQIAKPEATAVTREPADIGKPLPGDKALLRDETGYGKIGFEIRTPGR